VITVDLFCNEIFPFSLSKCIVLREIGYLEIGYNKIILAELDSLLHFLSADLNNNQHKLLTIQVMNFSYIMHQMHTGEVQSFQLDNSTYLIQTRVGFV
jgi:hypothetical protein